jgi:hypothetical protein
MRRKALALFSGGLDSILAVKLMLAQGIDVEAINFTSPFFMFKGGKGKSETEAVKAARELGIPVRVVELGVDFLEMISKPQHGYGSGMNPCIDCRIHFLRKARGFMPESGADFVITGEVLGQRPMSQRRDALRLIDRESGLEGLLLRPLSARHFAPTIPEREGWVDREKLPAISGRSRKVQMQLAEELDVKSYPCPTGGCLLTEPSFLSKIRDVFEHAGPLDPRDFHLLLVGRHFRLGPETKVIIGRNEGENQAMEQAIRPGDAILQWLDGSSPLGMVTGIATTELLETAARILLRYTKAETGAQCTIRMTIDGQVSRLQVVHEYAEADVEKFRV